MTDQAEIENANQRLRELAKNPLLHHTEPGPLKELNLMLGGLTRSVDRASSNLGSRRSKRAESLMAHVRLHLPKLEAFVAEHVAGQSA
jgi:hypothetical protein